MAELKITRENFENEVMSIPTIVLVKDGKVVKQAVGARPKAEVEEMLQ